MRRNCVINQNMRPSNSSQANDNDSSSIKHIEERLDRLVVVINEKLAAQHVDVLALINGNDTRYQQRFDAQSKALDFAAAAAKEAVTAALAGADKAAIKTEQMADKRFADLGVLIREQFKGMTTLFEGLSQRVKLTEDRLNLALGETTGMQHGKADSKAMWTLVLMAAAGLIALLAFLARMWKP